MLLSAFLIYVSRVRLLDFIGVGARMRGEDRERLRMAAAVFDSTLEGVLVTDRHGLIVHVNRAFMRITGYQQDEVMGQRPSKFKSGRHGLAFYQQIFATLAEQGDGCVAAVASAPEEARDLLRDPAGPRPDRVAGDEGAGI